jgi:8-oxo-dGTP pyrophosphatase MutT (NUDIX family)
MTWRRRAARLVLIDEDGRVFLQHSRDPVDASKPPWWELPGGGIDGGESSAEAARRELYEETGIDGVEMGPCVWTRHTRFTFAGWDIEQDEWIHVAWLKGPAPSWQPAHLEALEVGAFLGGRWWEVGELLASTDQTWPSRLREFVPDLVAGRLPPSPIDVGH